MLVRVFGPCIFIMGMISRYDMMLAIAMSEFHATTHVLFIPPNTHYKPMLTRLINEKAVVAVGESYWKLTEKSWEAVKSQQKQELALADAAIDKFIDDL